MIPTDTSYRRPVIRHDPPKPPPAPPAPRQQPHNDPKPQHYFSNDSFSRAKPLVAKSKTNAAPDTNPASGKFDLTGTSRDLFTGSWGKSGSLYSTSGSWGKPGSAFHAQGGVELGSASANAEGKVSADLKHGTISASGSAGASVYAINAHGEVSSHYGVGSTTASGNATVGASATADGNVTVDPLHGSLAASVHGDAFVGARAGVDLKQTVGPLGAEGGAKVEAGIGANFSLDAGFQHGKFNYKMDVGAALGIGVDFKVGFSVDGGAIAHGALDAGKATVNALGTAASSTTHALGTAAGATTHAIGGAAKSTWHAITSW